VKDRGLVEVVIPQLGEAVSEVRIVEWVKNEGDQISTGDVLFIVDTEKAEVDVEAFVDGVLVEIAVADDAATLPGAVVGLIRTAADAVGAEPPADNTDVGSSAPRPGAGSEVLPGLSSAVREKTRSDVRVSPKARRLARQLGVDPADAVSSRSDGVVAEADISLLAEASVTDQRPGETNDSDQRPGETNDSDQRPGETSDLARRIGETMAVRMAESKQTVPHFYLTVDVDMSRVLAVRDESKASGRGVVPSVTSFVVFAAAHAAREHPHLIFDDGVVIASGIGVAVATDAGLVVPTLETGDSPDLLAIHERLSGAAERARRLKLQPSDLVPKRLTVSNLGMFGIDSFYGIIDPPDTMLITVGATRDRVVARNKEISVRPVATFGLSADHRKMDGASAAPFLTNLRRVLESIDEFVVPVAGG